MKWFLFLLIAICMVALVITACPVYGHDCDNGKTCCAPSQVKVNSHKCCDSSSQEVYIPQIVGVEKHKITYSTPLRDLLFGKYKSTPIYQNVHYRLVTPSPQVLYWQPPSYLVPAHSRR